MRSEKEIQAKIEELKKANKESADWFNSEKAKGDVNEAFRIAAIKTYNSRLKTIKMLEWVLS